MSHYMVRLFVFIQIILSPFFALEIGWFVTEANCLVLSCVQLIQIRSGIHVQLVEGAVLAINL